VADVIYTIKKEDGYSVSEPGSLAKESTIQGEQE
jgi:hypothetical protein